MSIKDYEPVTDYYAGRSVFLTGVSGFLGKVILEKLLYSCKNIDKVYVMIRDKKGLSVEQRFHKIIDQPILTTPSQSLSKQHFFCPIRIAIIIRDPDIGHAYESEELPQLTVGTMMYRDGPKVYSPAIAQAEIFTRLKDKRPGDLNKIVPVTGDLTLPNLGIKDAVEESFVNKVTVVIHSAATIQYNQHLDEALNNNLEGTRRVLHLCRRMPHIQSFVHVSTAYANMERKVIDEVIYPAPANLDDVYASIKQYGVTNDEIIKKILNEKPNTYVFSKALAENMLLENHGDIPTTIVRPSTVCAAINEPMPGWVDNWFAATGIIHVTGSGYNRVIYGKRANILDITPVDYISNLILVAAAKNKACKDVPVYNSCTSSSNPITIGQLYKLVKNFYVHNKYYDIYPTLYFTQNKLVLNLLTFLMQMLPAKMGDLYLTVKGEKPKYAKLQSKVIQIRDAQTRFSGGSWVIKSEGTRSLFSSLSPEDKLKFPFDPTLINWKKYLPMYCQGIRRYLLKK